MKRVYTDRHLRERQSPSQSARKARSFVSGNYLKIIGAVAAILILLLVISGILVLARANSSAEPMYAARFVDGAKGPAPSPPSWGNLYASAAILEEAGSGRVLYSKNENAKLPMASTTKIMTALVVRDRTKLTDQVVIPPQAMATGEQEIELQAGERLSIEQLLYALLVHSANDAATSLAVHVAGSEAAFAELMNQKAKEMGASNSRFANPHGLDASGHYSSASDLALMGRLLLTDPVLAKMVATKRYEIPRPDGGKPRVCESHNEILVGVHRNGYGYPGATGIKTGYTIPAGQCLVASARRNDISLVAVVLNCNDVNQRMQDVTSLMNYGFGVMQWVVVLHKGEVLRRVQVSSFPARYAVAVVPREVRLLSKKGAGDRFRIRFYVEGDASGSVERGDVLGRDSVTLEYTRGNTRATDTPHRGKLTAAEDVAKPNFIAALFVFIWYTICQFGRILAAPIMIWGKLG